MFDFLGRFHPILVHFPIALFCTYIGLELLIKKSKKENLAPLNSLLLKFGCISSVVSLITGYILSLEGSNNQSAVDLHKWIAISTTSLFLTYFVFRSRLKSMKYVHETSLLILLTGIVITGHQGGSLTHGENFLFEKGKQKTNEIQNAFFTVEDMNQAKVYEDVVQFTLNQKCVPCHGQNKQKGKLRLDDQTWINKGGKNGPVLNSSTPTESELLKRILLDEIAEHHMPPKEKAQLSNEEKIILSWWIKTGIHFNTKVHELNPDSSILQALDRFKISNRKASASNEIKRKAIKPLDPNTIQSIEKAGWAIQALSKEDNHIRVVGYNVTIPISEALQILKNATEHLVELKLSFKELNDRDAVTIESFKKLEKLWIDHTPISDAFIANLNNMNSLKYINISFTKCSDKTLTEISKFTNIRTVYGYQTQIKKESFIDFARMYPLIKVMLGDSMIAAISDTIFSKKPEE